MMDVKTNPIVGLLVALLLVQTFAASAAMMVMVVPRDPLDQEQGGVPPEPEAWFWGKWSVDTRGADFTYGSSRDPMAENVTGLRDAALDDRFTNDSIPLLQEKQRGWMSGNLTIAAPKGAEQELAFEIRPGHGWFPSLDRYAGDDQNGDVVDWTPRTVGGQNETATLHWSVKDCVGSNGTYDLLGDMSNVPHPVERVAYGAANDGQSPDGVTVHRNDAVVFTFKPSSACTTTVRLEFALEFVHEVFAPMPDTRSDIGYRSVDVQFVMCRIGWSMDPGHECMGETRTESVRTDVFYMPIFPLQEVIQSQCGSDLELVECVEHHVQNLGAGTSGSPSIVWGDEEFLALATDKLATGFSEVSIFHLASLDYEVAKGNDQNMVIL